MTVTAVSTDTEKVFPCDPNSTAVARYVLVKTYVFSDFQRKSWELPDDPVPKVKNTWECRDCKRKAYTYDNADPYPGYCLNGHAECGRCGRVLPRLKCGCPRPHQWNQCPGKCEADKLFPQHSQPGGHHVRVE